jgi:hypothetical protein
MATLTPERTACNDRHVGGPAVRGGNGLEAAAGGVKSGGALGTNAKYKNKVEIDPETGEISGIVDPMESRLQRFALQAVARRFLPKSRTDKCLILRQKMRDIEVWKSKEHQTTHYTGLQTCGSVWACPVCASKIAERRRLEIQQAMAAHQEQGGQVFMLTLTTPHQFKDKLDVLLAMQAKALNRFWSDRKVKQVMQEMGLAGQIRAMEVTHGRKSDVNNGWHPHYHVLLFVGLGGRFDASRMKDWACRLYLVWAAACERAGLGTPSYAHGLKLDDGTHAAKYVSKWGLEDEMTKGHTKKSAKGETPFDFLRSFLADDQDKQARALFQEFAAVFKGKRQLHWSKGLKARFKVGEKDDEQLAAETDDAARLLGAITVEQWRDVIAAGGRGTVLSIAARHGWETVEIYLASICGVSKKVTVTQKVTGGMGASPPW